MKLNRIGFAITAILYGLLILFVFLVGSYLLILSARKNRLDSIVEEAEKSYFPKKVDVWMKVQVGAKSYIELCKSYYNIMDGQVIEVAPGKGCGMDASALQACGYNYSGISCEGGYSVTYIGSGTIPGTPSKKVSFVLSRPSFDTACTVTFTANSPNSLCVPEGDVE